MEATFSSNNSFKVVDNRTDEFLPNRRIKLDCGIDGIRYSLIISSVFTLVSNDTLVVIEESVVTPNILEVWYSVVKPGIKGNLPVHYHSSIEGDGGFIEPSPVTFIDLTDTPSTYSGTGGMVLTSTGSGTVWTNSDGTTSSFIDLTDTPSTYSGTGGMVLTSTGSGISWASGSEGSSWHYGDGIPLTSLGDMNDFYIDNASDTKNYYHKVPGSNISVLIISDKTHYANNVYGSPANLIDGNLSTYCQNMSYLAIDLGSTGATVVTKIQVAVHSALADFTFVDASPTFQGSNDSTNGGNGLWTTLITIDATLQGVPDSYPGFGNEITIDNSTSYRWYRLNGLTKTNNTVLNEWKLWERAGVEWTFVDQFNETLTSGTSSSTFVDLIDTPSTYSGTAELFLSSTGSGTQWSSTFNMLYGEGTPFYLSPSITTSYTDTDTGDVYSTEGGTTSYHTSYVGSSTNKEQVSASSVYSSSYPPELVFDAVDTLYWISSSSNGPNVNGSCWLQWDFEEPKAIFNFRMRRRPDGGSENFPAIMQAYSSATGSFSGEEVLVKEVTNNDVAIGEWADWNALEMSSPFRYLRIEIHSMYLSGNSATWVAVREVEFSETIIIGNNGWSSVYDNSKSFLDLVDTPTTYSGGQYLRTTSSGIEAVDGIIMKSPNNSEWLIQVTNSGTLYTTSM